MKKKLAMALMGLFLVVQSSVCVFAQGAEAIQVPEGYINPESKIFVTTNENEMIKVRSVQYKIGKGAYQDITQKMYFTVTENCTVDVCITYEDKEGNESVSEIAAEIKNFDGVKPEVVASMKGDVLTIQASDELSGVKLLNINGQDYAELTDGAIGINMKELEKTNEYLTVYAVDQALNKSSTYKIKNPYYVGEEPKSNTDQSVENPQSTQPTKPTDATATITAHTDENGTDLSNPGNNSETNSTSTGVNTMQATVNSKTTAGKQFFTIQTESDKTFYLVVDETEHEQTAYLLTEASENDLLNFVNYDGNTVDNGDVVIYSIAKEEESPVVEDETEEIMEEPEEEKATNKKSPLGIIVIVGMVVIAFYFFKFKKKDTDEEDDEIGDYMDESEEMLVDSERNNDDDDFS